jgi:DNA repair exonuclease SbcCD nuclease subunit
MEILAVGDLHLPASGAAAKGIGKYIAKPEKVICNEVRSVLNKAHKQGIGHALFLGDLCDGHQLSHESTIEFLTLLSEYPDIEFHVLEGNHDIYGAPKDGTTGSNDRYHPDHSKTSLTFLKQLQSIRGFRSKNLHLYSEPTAAAFAPIWFLPYGSNLKSYFNKFEDSLFVFHDEVKGSKGDNGRTNKKGVRAVSKSGREVAGVSGHLHTAQRVRNIWYPGTLYQTYFGEKSKKYYGIADVSASKGKLSNFEFELHRHHPQYKLHTCVIQSRKDLKKIPCSPSDLIKLVVEDGVPITTADYPSQANIVEVKPFKGLQELAQVLTSDLEVGEALQVDLDAFFDSWLEGLDVEDEVRAEVVDLRRNILRKAAR